MLTRLPLKSRASAVALATLGHNIAPKAYRHEGTGRISVEWSCDSAVPAAQQLLDQAEHPRPEQSLRAAAPEHPYLVCLYYQEALGALRAWLARSHSAVPALVRSGSQSRLIRAVGKVPPGAFDFMGFRLSTVPEPAPLCAVASAFHAAAAVVCGFLLSPQLTEAGGFLFSAESLTFPGLTMAALRAVADPSTAVLGGYAPGEHPACYALQCAANLQAFQQAEQLVLRNPVHMLRGEGTRSALMSEALLENKDPRYRDRLRLHLAGLT